MYIVAVDVHLSDYDCTVFVLLASVVKGFSSSYPSEVGRRETQGIGLETRLLGRL